MFLSLRKRVLLLLVATNAAVAAALFSYLTPQIAKSYEAGALQASSDLVYTIANTIEPRGELNVARILQWPNWPVFSDALIVDSNVELGAGGWEPRGVAISPLGSYARHGEVDRAQVIAALAAAVRSGVVVSDVEGGRVVPIQHPGGVWGACWYRIREGSSKTELFVRYFVPSFVASTLLLSIGTFLLLRRFVLTPVEQLAAGARAVARGDFSARVPEGRAQDELGELMRSFNRMTAQVQGFNQRLEHEVARAREEARLAASAAMKERRLAAMGELAAGIAHEINNPLGGLQNAVEVLARDELPAPKRKQYLALLHNGLERIRGTVGRLLRLVPRESAKTPVSLGACVADAVRLVAHRAARSGVELVLADERGEGALEELEPRLAELPPIDGRAPEIAQAVLNLLVNALDALDERASGGRIEVRLARVEGGLALSVIDDGPGVDPETLARAADLFFTTKEPGKGTGLGLAIVHGVIKDHGGALELASRPGEGFRATLFFPARGGGTLADSPRP